MDNLTLDQFLHQLGRADLVPARKVGHLAVYDRGEVLAVRQDIEWMRWRLNRNQPQSWIPWIMENRTEFVSTRFRTITSQGILNSVPDDYSSSLLAA